MFFYKCFCVCFLCFKIIPTTFFELQTLKTFSFCFIYCFYINSLQTVLFYTFFTVCSIFFRSSYKVLLSHAIGNLLRQNSLRIRKSTLYFFLTCLERAHSRLNTRASRTAISTPFNVFQYSFLSFLRTSVIHTIPYHVFAPISYCLRYIVFSDIYLSKNACCQTTNLLIIS